MPSIDNRNELLKSDGRKLVVLTPVNCRGHINMLLEYADILKQDHNYRTVFLIIGPTQATNIEQRGHELLVVRQDGDHRGLIAQLDEEKYTSFNAYNQATLDADIPTKNTEQVLRQLMFPAHGITGISRREWLAYHDNYERALYSLKPDLVLFDTIHLPPCASTLTIPWVLTQSINPSMLVLPKIATPPMPWMGFSIKTKQERLRLQREQPQKWQAMVEEWASKQDVTFPENLIPAWTELCARHNHNESNPYRNFSPYLNIYVYPTECDYDQDDDLFYYTPNWFRCDTIYRMDTEPNKMDLLWASKLDESMRERQQMVYFSLGTLASGYTDVINKYIEIFAKDTKRLYVVSKGVTGGKVKLNAPNVIGDNYLPQRLILKYASLAIIHGGNNSFLECVYFGVPMIVAPCFGDQFDNAARVEDLNIGRRLDLFKPETDKVLNTINELCNDLPLRKRLNTISQRVQSRDSRRQVSILLKKLVEERKLHQSDIEQCRQLEASGPETE